MGITCFIHVATINNYQDIVYEFIERIKESKLDQEANITFYVCGDKLLDTMSFNQIRTSSSITQGEFLTLNRLIDYAQKNEDNLMYIHTKGVTRLNNLNVIAWRKYMCFYCCDQRFLY